MGVALPRDSLATLGAVHLGAMREHDRKAALLHREGDRWEETPDWRLDRQVIRLGLYLTERVGVVPGQAVGILSPLRREWLLADLAAAVQGLVPVALDPDLSAPELASAMKEAAVRALFVSGPPWVERLARAGLPPRGPEGDRGGAEPPVAPGGATIPIHVVSFDGPAEGAAALSEALDLGGTLDTAERAVAFRARAREVVPEARALAWVGRAGDGTVSSGSITHREAVARVRALWSSAPARKGDVAYVAADPVALGVRLALLAFAGDGYTTLALGTAGREAEEITALRPHKIVAASAFLDAAAAAPAGARGGEVGAGVQRWLEHALRRLPLHRPRGEGEAGALGGRARWIRAPAALSGAPTSRARAAPVVSPGMDGTRGGAA